MTRRRRLVYQTAAIIALGMVALYALMWAFQRSLIYPRFRTDGKRADGAAVAGAEVLRVDTEEGAVQALLLPGDGVSAKSPGPAVMFAHGNGELIDEWPGLLAPYQRLGFTVLLPEYRGYGRAAGSPSQQGISRDFVAFYDQLVARPEVDSSRVVFHGRSLGGGVVCALATKRRPAALILMSTFTSVRAMARRYLLPGFLVRDPYDNLAVVTDFDGPVLIVHGTRDSLIPYSHARQLHRAAPQSELIAYDADHNDCPPEWPTFWTQARTFLRSSGVIPGV